ncbi:MAG TPA: hypothetical protein VGM64_15305 [Lacunisphaera sp.]|jgi:hypothetical protein
MTTLTKTLMATSFALTVIGFWQVRRVRNNEKQLHDLRQKSEENETNNRRMSAEKIRILSTLNTTQKAIEAAQQTGQRTTGSDNELSEWLGRVDKLKQALRAAPEKRIPEMDFLTSNDWLSVALNNYLDSDAKIRGALSELRAIAKRKPQIVGNIVTALQNYDKANNGPPSDPILLRPYLKPQLSNEILQRYETVPEVPGKNDGDVATMDGMRMVGSGRIILKEKAPADEDYDTWIIYTENGSATGDASQIGKMVLQAARSFSKANNGQDASTPEQLLPYFSTPVDPVRLNEYLDVSHH